MTKRLQWEKEAMKKAVDAVNAGQCSISAAARAFDVPRTTLSNKVRGKTNVECRVGRKPALTADEEEAIERYCMYMSNHNFPITRSNVIGLAWALAVRDGKKCFTEGGPSLKWWRGFRDRHPQLRLRKTEFIDKDRSENAVSDAINEYFDSLGQILSRNDLEARPQLIYNCDESVICLNKSTKKVLIPGDLKRCHIAQPCYSQHISAMCCINASGTTIPPLIIFPKDYPEGLTFMSEGPKNATYSTSDNGFINQKMYCEWFETNFLKFTTAERPLLLLQDGASTHISPQLIDSAIKNDVILMCFPPRLTHLLQPLDVGIYRTMKVQLSGAMHSSKSLHDELWVSKAAFPSVFKEVFANTFTFHLITDAFKRCGIYPHDRRSVLENEATTDTIARRKRKLYLRKLSRNDESGSDPGLTTWQLLKRKTYDFADSLPTETGAPVIEQNDIPDVLVHAFPSVSDRTKEIPNNIIRPKIEEINHDSA